MLIAGKSTFLRRKWVFPAFQSSLTALRSPARSNAKMELLLCFRNSTSSGQILGYVITCAPVVSSQASLALNSCQKGTCFSSACPFLAGVVMRAPSSSTMRSSPKVRPVVDLLSSPPRSMEVTGTPCSP